MRRGYAVAGTDNGHEGGGGADWAIGHPEKLIDLGYRAVHETAVQSKAIIRAFYGRDPERSYFNGCSDGGREALMEAQRFPEDFNGILAGAPANNWSRLFTAFVWNERALLATPDSAIPPAKLPVIQRAVMAACDRLDGVADGLIENPRACRFDPAVLVCKGADAADCLPKAQVDALQKVYEGPRNPRTQERLFVGQPLGTEAVPGSWGTWITPANPAGAIQFVFGNSYYGAAVFEDPKWNFRMLDFDRDVRIGDAKAGPVLNATSPDLRSFRASGGKLIQHTGGETPPFPRRVRSSTTRRCAPFFRNTRMRARLALRRPRISTGCFSCPEWRTAVAAPARTVSATEAVERRPAGDPERDIFTALERWVEQGVAPERLVGSGRATDDPSKPLTRPLCPYPQVAQYRGSGDVNDAANFACAAPSSR